MPIALTPGEGILSEYQLVRRVGHSAQSETWLVRDEEDGHKAIKLLIRAAGSSGLAKMSAARHPFLMHWDRQENLGVDVALLRDWAEVTLEEVILRVAGEQTDPLPRAVLLRHLEETAEVLDHLHKKLQQPHGHVTASNIGLQHEHVKLLDWRLLTREGLRERAWSVADLSMAPPELVRGEPHLQSDQFSLAAIFVRAITGQPVRTLQCVEDYYRSAPAREQPWLAQLPESDHPIILRALDRNPAARFANCLEMVRALPKDASGKSTITAMRSSEQAPQKAENVGAKKTGGPEAIIPQHEVPESKQGSAEKVPSSIIKSFVGVDGNRKERHPDSSFLNLSSLVYNTEVTSRGVLTPTLVIGLGKPGIEVLQQVKRQLHDQFGPDAAMPHVRFLAIDGEAGSLPEHPAPGQLGKEQSFSCRPIAPSSPAWKELGLHQRANWIAPEHLQQLGHGHTPPLRSLGRLSVVAQYGALRDKLTAECKAMLLSKSLMEAKNQSGLPVRQDLTPTVYLACGLGDAVGSGALMDLTYLVRSVLGDLGWGHARLSGLLLLPADADSDTAKANAYASVVEMNHYTQESFFSAQYGAKRDYFHLTQRPFEEAFFWKMPTETLVTDRQQVLRDCGNWIVRDLTTPLYSMRQACRELANGIHHVEETPWRSQGLCSLSAGREFLRQRASRMVMSQLMDWWLEPRQEIVEELAQEGERFLDENHFSAPSVLARFEHVAALVLGREPMELIDEWVAPLRKGAAARPPLETLAADISQKVELYFGRVSGLQPSPAMLAIQHEADAAAQEICAQVPRLMRQYLEKPGYRIGASLKMGDLLMDWVSEQLTEIQASHASIEEEMIRAERTLTQMVSQEERSFTVMGRQRQISQIAQDLIDYPARVLREDMFARLVFVFQQFKETITNCLQALEPGEHTLAELRKSYLEGLKEPLPFSGQLILEGRSTLSEWLQGFRDELPSHTFAKLERDFAQTLASAQLKFSDVCQGKEGDFRELLTSLDGSVEELLEDLLPPADAAEQLLRLPSQSIIEKLRDSFRESRPPLSQQLGSRQGSFCLFVTPGTPTAEQLLQMAQSTLPQIITNTEGSPQEIFLYRETGPLRAEHLYPQGKKAYEALSRSIATSPHSRADITYWHALRGPGTADNAVEQSDEPSVFTDDE